MRECIIFLTITAAALAQATVPSGVPLRVALERRVVIKHAGDPVQGRLLEPVYVFDRAVLPAGALVEGHVAEVGGIPTGRRLAAILSGNLTPPREVRAEFDALVLNDGSRLSLQTFPALGTAHMVVVANPRKQAGRKSRVQGASRIKTALLSALPYHRRSWAAGTSFTSVLRVPLAVPAPTGARIDSTRLSGSEVQEVRARLLTPMSSATARRGTAVEAVVTQPVFSSDHRLLIPEGSRVFGDVVAAKRARWFHRNGNLRFVFRRIELGPDTVLPVQGSLAGLETDFDAHLALDSEGAARATSPKTRFLLPAIAVAVAGLSLHQDYNSGGVPDQDIAGRAESGAVGLGLIGTLVAQASHTLASGIAFTGAGYSVYSNFIARGTDVTLSANTPIEVSLAPLVRDKPASGSLEAQMPHRTR